MASATYISRRGELETYFDRTAVEAWTRLTSDVPVGSIRATVRAGRNAMREAIMSYLPANMEGLRLLDAGCGTGALAAAAAQRGADVTAIDLSPTLVGLAKDRIPRDLSRGQVSFSVGDMLDPALGTFDHVVAMDSLIHYRGSDIARTLASLASRTRRSVVFTIAPRTPALTVMHAIGRLFPRGERAPAIEPISQDVLERFMRTEKALDAWLPARTHRITTGFYVSQAIELKQA